MLNFCTIAYTIDLEKYMLSLLCKPLCISYLKTEISCKQVLDEKNYFTPLQYVAIVCKNSQINAGLSFPKQLKKITVLTNMLFYLYFLLTLYIRISEHFFSDTILIGIVNIFVNNLLMLYNNMFSQNNFHVNILYSAYWRINRSISKVSD